MPHLDSSRKVGALFVAGLAGLGLSVLSVQPGQAETSVPQVTPGRVVVADLRPSSFDEVVAAPADLDDAVAVSTAPTVADGVRGANLALKADGTVVGWGADLAGETRPPADLSGVTGVDLGGGFALAVRDDGSVVAWGGDESGVLDVPADLTDVTAVAALGTGACGFGIALRSDGTLVQWGGTSCDNGMPYQLPEGLTGITAVAAGDDAAIALRSDGTVATWGPSGNLGFLDGVRPSLWTGVTQVSTQSRTFVGVTEDHKVLAYGVWGEAGAPTFLTDVATASAGYTAAFLKTDGSAVLYQGNASDLPAPPYSALEGGFNYVVAIVPTTPAPTESPTTEPTTDPTTEPTTDPTSEPTSGPTTEPTAEPTPGPTSEPTQHCAPRRHRHHKPRPAPTSSPTPSPTPTANPAPAA